MSKGEAIYFTLGLFAVVIAVACGAHWLWGSVVMWLSR